MKEVYMKLPRDGYETVLFMGIVSIISVNLIAPMISMLETGFSWAHYLNTLQIIPFMWLAVIIVVALAQAPATKLKNLIVDNHDSFASQVTIDILCHVIVISAVLTIIGTWIGQRTISLSPFFHYFNNWPRNFAIAFAVEGLIAQPIARKALFYKHSREKKWR